uniref:Uncharacterized protein n=1 Tax=Rhizophora mucronata TaxID=61149 RepID=A0A2P2ITF0_RHIMU
MIYNILVYITLIAPGRFLQKALRNHFPCTLSWKRLFLILECIQE